MLIKWFSLDNIERYQSFILAGDIGGTNTNLAVLGRIGDKFELLVETVSDSRQIVDLLVPLKAVIGEFLKRGPRIDKCCISGAGPVKNNFCDLSNLDWVIDGQAISTETGIPTVVINDFAAISYSLPLLDVQDENQVVRLAHTDGRLASPGGEVFAVVGAGTGLGVGMLAQIEGRYRAFFSEGGHCPFAPFDEDTQDMYNWLVDRKGPMPGSEYFVSGQGLEHILEYYADRKNAAAGSVVSAILSKDRSTWAAEIFKNAESDPDCAEMVDMFVRMYARFASATATFMLPTRGLYLAGGIVSKNWRYFSRDGLFMRYFEQSYKPVIRDVLARIPVYIIRDYSISLYGAANAAENLL